MNEYELNNSSNHHNNHDTYHSHHSKENSDKQSSSWYNRDGRSHPSYLQKEEEDYFHEHLENLHKKKSKQYTNIYSLFSALNIEALEKIEFSITYNSEEQNDQKDIDSGNQPLDKFDTLKETNKQLANNIYRLRFDYMTPIQKVVIPYMQQKKDVMGCSETGSGKTIAYLFPVISVMLLTGPPHLEDTSRKTAYPVSLILVPTRELADQVYKESKKMCYQTGINTVRVYGGVPYPSQISSLSLGCDILVSTPGRLIDYLKTGTISLKAVTILIIDEADRILDMGFEDQLNTIIFNYDLPQKEKRQNLMFSATFSPEVRKIARKFMNEFYFVQPKTVAPKQIKQEIIKASDSEKNQILSQILSKLHGSIIIFLDTKRGVDSLSYFLYNNRFKCCSIHGDKKQTQRQNAIENFTLGHVPILIATDVASRGLDFPNVHYVVNYDLPKNLEDYIHRIGRTGRMGQEGTAISFINEGNKPIIKKLYLFFKTQGQVIPPWFEEMYLKDGEEDRYKRNGKFKMNMGFNRPTNNYGYMTGFNRNGMMNGYRMNNGFPPYANSSNSNSNGYGNNGVGQLSMYGMNGNNTNSYSNSNSNHTALDKNALDAVNVNGNGNNQQLNGFSQSTLNNNSVDSNTKDKDGSTTNTNTNNNSNSNSNSTGTMNNSIPYQANSNPLMYYQKTMTNQSQSQSQGYPSNYNSNYSQRMNYHNSSYFNNTSTTTPYTNNSSNSTYNHNQVSKSRDKDNSQSPKAKQPHKDQYNHSSSRLSKSRSRSKNKKRRHSKDSKHSSRHSHSRSHYKSKRRDKSQSKSNSRSRSRSRSRDLRNRNKSKSLSRSRSRDAYSRDRNRDRDRNRHRRRNDSPKHSDYRNNSRDQGNKNQTYYYSNRNRSNGDVRYS